MKGFGSGGDRRGRIDEDFGRRDEVLASCIILVLPPEKF